MHRYRTLIWLLVLIVLCGCLAHRPIQETKVASADVNGVRLGYRMLGSGPPLLLIMGYGGTMDVWDRDMVVELALHRTLILFDNRGIGQSTIDESPLTLGQMASDASNLLSTLGIERADVMGWSMGSMIAQEMALDHPDKVGKLVLYATAVDPGPVKEALDAMAALPPEEFMERLFPAVWKDRHPGIYATLPAPAAAPSADVVQRQYEALVNWPGTRARLGALHKDTLVIVGENDRITPPAQALAAVGGIENAWLVRFNGADHWLMYQAGGSMARTIEHFLETREDLLLD